MDFLFLICSFWEKAGIILIHLTFINMLNAQRKKMLTPA
jgi:hypothetical protein